MKILNRWIILSLLCLLGIASVSAQVQFDRADLDTGSTASITLTSGDLDGDNNLDLVVAHDVLGSIIVLLGDGTGGFSDPVTIPTPNNPFFLVLKDFNGDGILDLSISDFSEPRVHVLLGDGKGGFSPPASFAVHHNNTGHVVEDFNGDGCWDIATANFGFCNQTCDPAGADNTVSVLLGDCTGNFTPAEPRDYTVGLAPEGVYAADFNNDDIADIVTLDFHSHSVSLLIGNGDGTFQPARTFPLIGTAFPAYGLIGDFNGDGNWDLATANWGTNNVSILLGDGNGGFSGPTNFPVGGMPRVLVGADFNGDGNLDLAASDNLSEDVWLLLGDGQGNFQPLESGFPVLKPWFITIGDFNNDGLWDLITTGEGSPNNTSILFGTK